MWSNAFQSLPGSEVDRGVGQWYHSTSSETLESAGSS